MEAGNALVAIWDLQVSMCGDDHLFSGGSHSCVPFENAIKNLEDSLPTPPYTAQWYKDCYVTLPQLDLKVSTLAQCVLGAAKDRYFQFNENVRDRWLGVLSEARI
ncbi:hypothetical protein EVAR_51885_1 [Eumeta japonica]|uniref:Uncharacterized protein n=1 Tax=Eumeta variegata TaxID=151549 RepID=A0A4C1YI23_EUMVA|nr:hypothetical protein EVAR_51885_1 [Eumeta japonica]